MVCACSHRLVTAAANPMPMSKRRGEGERREGTGEARGDPKGLRSPPRGVRGDMGVGGREGDHTLLLPRSTRAWSGRRPPEKSVPG